MKKFIFNVIAIVCISCMTFANTNEIKEPLSFELEGVEITNNSAEEYPVYWCVAYYSTTSTNPMDGSTTTTTYYACTRIDI